MPPTKNRKRNYWVVVLELTDVVPRRHPKRPNLFVGVSISPPDTRLALERARKTPRWYTDAIVGERLDLAPARRYSSKETADRACERLTARLKREGFTVNRDTRIWSVYVVELDFNAVSKPGRGFVYVGETSLLPEERFKQHMEGSRNRRGPLFSRVVHKHGVRLRPDLAPRRRFFDQASSRRAEKQHFDRLKAKGFAVRGGH